MPVIYKSVEVDVGESEALEMLRLGHDRAGKDKARRVDTEALCLAQQPQHRHGWVLVQPQDRVGDALQDLGPHLEQERKRVTFGTSHVPLRDQHIADLHKQRACHDGIERASTSSISGVMRPRRLNVQ